LTICTLPPSQYILNLLYNAFSVLTNKNCDKEIDWLKTFIYRQKTENKDLAEGLTKKAIAVLRYDKGAFMYCKEMRNHGKGGVILFKIIYKFNNQIN